MNWNRIRCFALGHVWHWPQAKQGYMGGKLGGARICLRCDTEVEGLKYPPCPPMPECAPPAPDLRTAYEVIAACVNDSVTRGDVSINKARMAMRQVKAALPREFGGRADARPANTVTANGANINPPPTGKRPPPPPAPPPARRSRW